MKTRILLMGNAVLLVLAVTVGCAVTNPNRPVVLRPTVGAGIELSGYHRVTVVPFDVTSSGVEEPSVGERLARAVTWWLRYGCGRLFDEIRQGQPLHQTGELVVTGVVSEYKRGTQNFGGWRLSVEVTLKDAATGRVLFAAPFASPREYPALDPTDTCRRHNTGAEHWEGTFAESVAAAVAVAKGRSPASK
jgi:hypothetical protein